MSMGSSSEPFAGVRSWAFLGLLAIAWPVAAPGQRITNTANGTLAGAVAFGTLTPAHTTAPTSGQIQFLLRNSNTRGYHVDASATFTPTTTGAVAGGATIAASDIGVGITSIIAASGVITPRTDAILYGFGYDPTTAVASTGVTPYLGAASGQATLADLLASKMILSGPRIDTVTNLTTPDYLTVTMKFGLLPQYFTPGSFTAIITLTITNGP